MLVFEENSSPQALTIISYLFVSLLKYRCNKRTLSEVPIFFSFLCFIGHGDVWRLIRGGERLCEHKFFYPCPSRPPSLLEKRQGISSKKNKKKKKKKTKTESVDPRDGWYGLSVPRGRQSPGTTPPGSDVLRSPPP